jgi:hypothetical protein
LDEIKLVETNNTDINEIEQKLIDSIGYFLSRSRDNWTFNPKSGTVNAIINSSSLDIIKNDSLRRAIISWNDVLSDYLEDERINNELFDEYRDWSRHIYDRTKRPANSEYYSLISSKEQKNFSVFRIWTLRGILKAVKEEGVIDLVDTIVTLTENEIEK